MATKHIEDAIWRKVEKKTVEAIIHLKVTVKDSEMLKWLINKGLETITEEDYEKFKRKQKEEKSK